MRMMSDFPHREENGFTLIELVIGMVLSVLALAMAISAIIGMFGSSERSHETTRAQRSVATANNQLQTDLHSMRAPEREPRYSGSPDNLRGIFLEGFEPDLLVHDLLEATPTRMVLYAEAITASRSEECIVWNVEGDGSLTRTVHAFTRGCAPLGAVLERSEMMPAPERARAGAEAAIRDPFSYNLLVQPAPGSDPDPSKCTSQYGVARPTGIALNPDLGLDQVTGVSFDLRSFVAGHTARGDQQIDSVVSISSRQSLEYRYAIGCVS